MKAKTFTVLSIVLVAALAAGGLILYQKTRSKGSSEMGAPLIAEMPAGDIAAISIQTPKETVDLANETDGWVVQTRFQYPADFSRIRELVEAVKEAKVGRSFESSQEIRERLSLLSPADTAADEGKRGALVEIKNEKGEVVAGVLLGETRKRGGEEGVQDGQYVMLHGSRNIYLVDKIFTSFETGNASWISKTPVNIDREDIARISCEGPNNKGIQYVFERGEKGKDFALSFPSSPEKIDRSALSRLTGALSALQIDDVQLRPDTSAKEGQFKRDGASIEDSSRKPEQAPVRIHFTLFDGMIYHVYPDSNCSETGPCRMEMDVSWEKPAWKGEEEVTKEGAEEKDKGEEKAQADSSVTAAQEHDRLSPWIFVVPKWRHDAFLANLNELIEKDEEESKG